MTSRAWHFDRYQKINDSRSAWHLQPDALRALSRLEWVVTEKIHGANLCFMTDGQDIAIAKRKAILTPDDPFFGVWSLLPRLRPNLLTLFERLQTITPDLTQVSVYGELFGGHYPHPDIPEVPGTAAVQTGVYYCPDIQFCAFDVAIFTSHHHYLDDPIARAHLDAVEILNTQPLFVGTFDDAIAYPSEMTTTLPTQLGLPPLPGTKNLAEGIIVKPTTAHIIQTPKGPTRPLLKLKIPQFAEDARYHQAKKPTHNVTPQTDPMLIIEWEMLARLTPSRLHAAISKEGHPKTDTQRATLCRAVVTDIWEDLQDAHPDHLQHISQQDITLLQEVLLDEVTHLLHAEQS